MLKTIYLNLLVFGFFTSYSQQDSSTVNKTQLVSPWTHSGTMNFGGTNFSFSGQNKYNINLSESLNYRFNYRRNNILQSHEFLQMFNITKNGDEAFRKSADNLIYHYRLEIDHKQNTNYGFLINLNTQLAPGTVNRSFNDASVISSFFAPAIVTEGLTYGFNSNKGFHITFAPLSGKHTLVLNKNIDPLKYGVDIGKRARHEFGTFLKLGVDGFQISKKILFSTHTLLFTNYLEDFGSIDIATANNLQINLTKWLSFNYNMTLSYDDDHNIPILNDLVTNNSNSLNYTGSQIQIFHFAFLAININLDLVKNKLKKGPDFKKQ